MIICIECFDEKLLPTLLKELANQCANQHIDSRIIQFPSEGPFGHQIRVVDSDRITMDPFPIHMLRMVDRMDVFLNPHNGLLSTKDISNELLILTGSQYKECLKTNDPDIQQWILEINTNIPNIDLLLWVTDNNENSTQTPPGYPPYQTIQIDNLATTELAEKVIQKILNEAQND